MWWLLTAYYIQQFNENSPTKIRDMTGKEKRNMWWLFTFYYCIARNFGGQKFGELVISQYWQLKFW